MAVVTVAKGGTSFAPARGPAFPLETETRKVQAREETGDGTEYIQDAAVELTTHILRFPVLTGSEVDDFLALFDAAGGASSDVTYTDPDSTARTVRWVDEEPSYRQLGGGIFEAEMTLVEETIRTFGTASTLATERAAAGNVPIHLVELELNGGAIVHRFSGAAITWNGNSYLGQLESVMGVEQYDDLAGDDRSGFVIDNRDGWAMDAFDANSPEGEAARIYRWFGETPENDANRELLFSGVVARVEFSGVETVIIELEEIGAGLSDVLGNTILESDLADVAEEWKGRIFPLAYGAFFRLKAAHVLALGSGELRSSFPASASGNTDIGLTNPDDFAKFPTSGTIQIADEKIAYTGKDTTNLYFTGITRASSSTTAADHFRGDLVIEVGTEKYAVQGPIKQIDAVYAGGELVDAGDYAVTLSDTVLVSGLTLTTIAFAGGRPRGKAIDSLPSLFDIDLDEDVSSTADDPTFAAGAHANWTERNYAIIDEAGRDLILRHGSAVVGVGEILKVWAFCEFVVKTSAGAFGDASVLASDSVGLFVNAVDQGDLVGLNLPSEIQERGDGLRRTRAFYADHTHTISQTDHAHDTTNVSDLGSHSHRLAGSRTSEFKWVSPVFILSPSTGEYARWQDTGSVAAQSDELYAQLTVNEMGPDTAIVTSIRVFVQHGDDDHAGAKSDIRIEIHWNTTNKNAGTHSGSATITWDQRTWEDADTNWVAGMDLADIPNSLECKLETINTSGVGVATNEDIFRCYNVKWQVRWTLASANESANVSNLTKNPIERTFVDFFDITSTVAGAWSWFEDKQIKASYQGSTDNAEVWIMRMGFVVDVASEKEEESSSVTIDGEGLRDDGTYTTAAGDLTGTPNALIETPVDVIAHLLVAFAGLAQASLDSTSHGATRTSQSGASLKLAGGIDEKRSPLSVIEELGTWGRQYTWFDPDGKVHFAYRGALGAAVKTITLPDEAVGVWRAERLPLAEVVNQVVLRYGYAGGEFLKSTDAKDATSITAYGVREGVADLESRWLEDDTAAAAIASWLSTRYATVNVRRLELVLMLAHGDLNRYDVLAVTCSVLNWTGKKFRILRMLPEFGRRIDGRPDVYRLVCREE